MYIEACLAKVLLLDLDTCTTFWSGMTREGSGFEGFSRRRPPLVGRPNTSSEQKAAKQRSCHWSVVFNIFGPEATSSRLQLAMGADVQLDLSGLLHAGPDTRDSSQGVSCKQNLVHRKDAWTRWQLRDVDLRAQLLGLLPTVPGRTWDFAIVREGRARRVC
jgi:hypothetical protein